MQTERTDVFTNGANAAYDVAMLDALVYPAVVLDADGVIRAANAAWQGLAATTDHGGDGFVGWNYITVCLSARGPWNEGADDIAAGLKAVLKGERSNFTHTYPCPIDGQPRWYQLVAGPIRRDGQIAGILLQHVDVTRSATEELEDLTPREKAILMGIVGGLSNKEIARRDDVSESAVKLHLRNIFQKLRVSNRTQAAMRGERLMLLGSDSLGDALDDGPEAASFPPGE